MKAKFINEKFSDKSDPIVDMGIGIIAEMKTWLKSKNIQSDFTNRDDACTLLKAFINHDKFDFIKFGVKNKIFNIFTKDYNIILGNAAYKRKWGICKILVNNGVDLDQTIRNHRDDSTPITYKNLLHFKKMMDEGTMYESFTEDSDPIKDMGIGIDRPIDFEDKNKLTDWVIEYLTYILKVEKIPDDIIKDDEYYIKEKYTNIIKEYANTFFTIKGKGRSNEIFPLWKKMRNIYEKQGYDTYFSHVFEAFTEDSDPIADMGIGIINKLEKISLHNLKYPYSIQAQKICDVITRLMKLPENKIYSLKKLFPDRNYTPIFNLIKNQKLKKNIKPVESRLGIGFILRQGPFGKIMSEILIDSVMYWGDINTVMELGIENFLNEI